MTLSYHVCLKKREERKKTRKPEHKRETWAKREKTGITKKWGNVQKREKRKKGEKTKTRKNGERTGKTRKVKIKLEKLKKSGKTCSTELWLQRGQTANVSPASCSPSLINIVYNLFCKFQFNLFI